MSQMMLKYQQRPAEQVIDAKQENYERMQNHSAYLKTPGYKCEAIQRQIRHVSRKRALFDPHYDTLKPNDHEGHMNITDSATFGLEPDYRRPSASSL